MLKTPKVGSLPKFRNCYEADYKDVIAPPGMTAMRNGVASTGHQEQRAFLLALGSLASPLPQYPYYEAQKADHIDRQDHGWFWESPEFDQWHRGDSEFLWLSGKPKSGKTVVSFCLWDYLTRNHTSDTSEDIAIYFCAPAHMRLTPERQITQILSMLVSQLLRSNEERLELVAKQCQLPVQPRQQASVSSSQSFLRNLWRILFTSVTALPRRPVIIIIDGIDTFLTERARQDFLKKLLELHTRVRTEHFSSFKILITSKPFDDINKELAGVPNIERGKEMQRTLNRQCNRADTDIQI